MNRTVFILGAGASREAGGPLMRDFVAQAEKIYRAQTAGAYQDSFRLVFQAREKLQRVFVKSSLDLDNIEELFAAFEMAGLIGRLADLEASQVSQLSTAMRRVITTTLNHSMQFSFSLDTGQICPPPVYQAFVRLIEHLTDALKWPISIITFNYDLGVDYALTCAGKRINYGLRPNKDETAIELFKLHGSLNWFRDGRETVIAEINPVIPLGPDRVPERTILPAVQMFAPGQSLPDPSDPLVVPPTWNKGQYHQEFQTLWSQAGNRLADAENIIVIGYSAPPTDQFYKLLYAVSTISDTILERYICVGPDVARNHQQLMGGAGQKRNVLHHLPTAFSESFSGLLKLLGISGAELEGLFRSHKGLAHELEELARWPSKPRPRSAR